MTIVDPRKRPRRSLDPTEPGQHPLPVRKLRLRPRELQILRLRAAGLSRQEIADRLVISVGTIDTHLTNAHERNDLSVPAMLYQIGAADNVQWSSRNDERGGAT